VSTVRVGATLVDFLLGLLAEVGLGSLGQGLPSRIVFPWLSVSATAFGGGQVRSG